VARDIAAGMGQWI